MIRMDKALSKNLIVISPCSSIFTTAIRSPTIVVEATNRTRYVSHLVNFDSIRSSFRRKLRNHIPHGNNIKRKNDNQRCNRVATDMD